MLPSYFDYIFVHLRQKAHLSSELSPKFLLTLGPNPIQTRPEKPGPIYNSGAHDKLETRKENGIIEVMG